MRWGGGGAKHRRESKKVNKCRWSKCSYSTSVVEMAIQYRERGGITFCSSSRLSFSASRADPPPLASSPPTVSLSHTSTHLLDTTRVDFILVLTSVQPAGRGGRGGGGHTQTIIIHSGVFLSLCDE